MPDLEELFAQVDAAQDDIIALEQALVRIPSVKLFAQVDAAQDDIIALEQALVRIPSVNTGFMPTGDETGLRVCPRLVGSGWD